MWLNDKECNTSLPPLKLSGKAAEVGNVNSDMTANIANNQTSQSLRVPG
jgi:hypothetical protein